MSRQQRLKQGWSRKKEGERLNIWLTIPTHRALKELCERDDITPSEAVEEALLERDLLRQHLGLSPMLEDR
jgi:hypothetical protein